MSGVAGILHRDDGPLARDALDAMAVAMAARGPDGQGTWLGEAVGLARLLHRTTPESRREEPEPLVRGHLTLTADLRLDNRADLISWLRVPGDSTDMELLLFAYERWGEGCVHRLLGDFAFLIWDARRRAMFCARDHFGVKPLVYHLSDRLFAVASQPAGLFALPAMPRRIDETYLARFIAYWVDDATMTVWRDLRRLPPAHTLTVSAHSVQLSCYWSPQSAPDVRLRSNEEYAAMLRDIFTTAVRDRLRSIHPMGIALSGGVDSSSVAVVARGLLPPEETLDTYTMTFNHHPEADERQYAEMVLRGGNFRPHLFPVDEAGPFAAIGREFAVLEEPLPAPNLWLQWPFYEAARTAGLSVFLDGFGGDQIISHGANRIAELLWHGHFRTGRHELQAVTSITEVPRLRSFARAAAMNAVPGGARAVYRAARRRPRTPVPVALDPVFARRTGTSLPQTTPSHRRERDAHLADVTAAGNALALEAIDRASTAHGVEPRHPFFDRRLAEFCLGLPAEQKLSGGWPRLHFRRAMEGILPPEVQWRRDKADLSPALVNGMLYYDRAQTEGALASTAIEAYVDRGALDDAWERLQGTRSEVDLVPVWKWAYLALWLEGEANRAHIPVPDPHDAPF